MQEYIKNYPHLERTTGLRILVIMLYWYPYEGPLMPIYSSIFTDLIERGHNVTIITSFPHYRKGRKETWEEFRGKLYERTEWEGIGLVRTYVLAPRWLANRLSLIYRGLNYISFNISSLIVAILLRKRPHIIFAPSSPPLTNGIIAWIVARLKRCRVVYNVQDLYPDMAQKMDLVRNRFVLGLLRRTEKLVYYLSDTVLTISSGMKNLIRQKGVSAAKLASIENFIDADFIRPDAKSNDFSTEFALDQHFVVMYAGNIGVPHGVEVLVRAAEKLQEKENILFCFVVRGEHKERIRLLAREKNLSNVRFIDPQPQERVPQIWASASVGVVTYRSGLADYSVPSKLLAMMCAARPVIASLDLDSEAARMVGQAQCGLVVEPEDATALAQAVLRLRDNAEETEKMGFRGRFFVETHFNRKVISEKYERLFLDLSR